MIESGAGRPTLHRLHFEEGGAGFPLVLVHGHTLDAKMWGPQLPAFEARFRVVRPELRGYGLSAPSSEPFTYAADLEHLLDDLKLKRAHLLGLSLGGAAALDFAISRPERVGKLVLVGSSLGGFPRDPEFAASLEAVFAAARESGLEAARRLWLAHPMFAPSREQPKVRAYLENAVAGYPGWHWANGAAPSAPVDARAFERLAEVRAPTLVIVGERDIGQNQRIANALADGIPGARKLVMAGVGHLPNLEDPAAFNAAVLEFLEEP